MSRKEREETRLGKWAVFWAICETLSLAKGEIYFDGYEKDSDRVEFQSEGYKCRLLELNSVDYEDGKLELTVLAKGNGFNGWEPARLDFDVESFRFTTLKRIATEAYMVSYACHNEIWADDVDAFLKEKMANWFDSYDSEMGITHC